MSMTLLEIWNKILPRVEESIAGMTDPGEKFWGRSSQTFYRTMRLEMRHAVRLRICSVRQEWVVLVMREARWTREVSGSLDDLGAIPLALVLTQEVNRSCR